MPVLADLLPAFALVDVGPDFPVETLEARPDDAAQLLKGATEGVPGVVLQGLDAISRRWLVKHGIPGLQEIDRLAQRLGRPGGHFLSVNYEWGCSVSVGPSPDGRSARLARTLDWFTPGLGRFAMVARVRCDAGPFATMTWPGFTGVLQAMAPGRFSASINQAPLRRSCGGIFAFDWLAAKARVWRTPHMPPILALRRIFETARDFTQARRMMIETPLASPVTFALAGIAPHETCIIERREEEAYVIDGAGCVTNHWQGLDHGAHSRGLDSEGRYREMAKVVGLHLDAAMPWLKPPVLNDLTRLAMVLDAAEGRLVVQGYEDGAPATRPLELAMVPPAARAVAGIAAE